MSNNRKNSKKNAAFRRFIVALLIILTLCVIGYVLILLGRGGERSYVPTEVIDVQDIATRAPIVVETPEPETTESPASTEMLEQAPTEGPALLAPEPTVEPTPIPGDMYAKRYTDFNKLPEISKDGSAGISRSYASEPDSYATLIIEGWGYVNDPNFSGGNSGAFIVLRNRDTDAISVFIAEKAEGISGREHQDSLGKDPSSADWRACIDVSGFDSGEYAISIVVGFKDASTNKRVFRRYALTDMQNITIKDGEVIIPPLPSES